MNAAGSSNDAPAQSPPGETAGAAKQEPASAPIETDAPECCLPGEVSGVKVEHPESSSHEEVSGTQNVHMDDAGDADGHDADEAMGGSPPLPKPQQKQRPTTRRPLRTLLGQRKKKAWLTPLNTRTLSVSTT